MITEGILLVAAASVSSAAAPLGVYSLLTERSVRKALTRMNALVVQYGQVSNEVAGRLDVLSGYLDRTRHQALGDDRRLRELAEAVTVTGIQLEALRVVVMSLQTGPEDEAP